MTDILAAVSVSSFHLSGRFLHLVVQLFDLLLQLLHVVQHLNPLLFYTPHFLL